MEVCYRTSSIKSVIRCAYWSLAIAHQLPSDTIIVHTITVNDNLIDFTVYGDKVFSQQTSSDSLIKTILRAN